MINVLIKSKLIVVFCFCYVVAIGQNSKPLDFIIDTSNFVCFSLDINNDTKQDFVYVSKPIKGDSLYVYVSTKEGYECSLKTLSFSQEDLYLVEKVSVLTEKKLPLLRIQTRFNGSGGQLIIFFIAYNAKKNQWKIIRTQESGTICQAENDCCEYLHIIEQQLILDEKVNWNRLRHCKNHGRDFCK